MPTFTNARVFDGNRALLGHRAVTVGGNRITRIRDQADAELDDAIDLKGMTLMPGLISCHFHSDFYKFTLAQGLAGDPLGKELPPGVLMAIGVRNCGVLLESGFTGYVGAACGHDIDAQLKLAIEEGVIQGPRIRACSPHLGTTGDLNDSTKWWRRMQTPGTDVFGDGPHELRKMVREFVRRGSETIKIFASRGHGFPGRTARNMDRDEIAAIVSAAHGRGARVRAHVADKAMIMECIELGVDILDHADEIDDEVIAGMVAAGTFWVPSLIYPKCLIDLGWADDEMRRHYDHVRKILPTAQKAGVRILIGDDYSGVFREALSDDPLDHVVGNYAREFAYYGAIDGLSAEQVLTWGTGNAGEALLNAGASERLGVIEEGALADLIVVDGDPLADLSLLSRPQENLKLVLRDGNPVIDRLSAPAAQTACRKAVPA